MFKKILLLICIAFVVVCYAYPCFVLPFGTYKGKIGTENPVEVSCKFGFDGKAVYKVGNNETEYYYKLSGNDVILSVDQNFDKAKDIVMEIDSMYTIQSALDVVDLENNIGMYCTIGIGVLALILVLLPSKRR